MKMLITAAIISLSLVQTAQGETLEKATSDLLKQEAGAVGQQINEQIRHDIRISILSFRNPNKIDMKSLLVKNNTNAAYQSKKR
jgi:hypothetical protein